MLSEQLYTEYVRQYTDSMLRIAVNYCRQLSDAEDIVQDAFLKLYETDTPFKDSEHVKRWLIRVTCHLPGGAKYSLWDSRNWSWQRTMHQDQILPGCPDLGKHLLYSKR